MRDPLGTQVRRVNTRHWEEFTNKYYCLYTKQKYFDEYYFRIFIVGSFIYLILSIYIINLSLNNKQIINPALYKTIEINFVLDRIKSDILFLNESMPNLV